VPARRRIFCTLQQKLLFTKALLAAYPYKQWAGLFFYAVTDEVAAE